MKILNLKAHGFRSLHDVDWKPGDLNVVIGPNASGKSNLLRLLELISSSAKGKLKEHIIDEGGYGAIAWDNSEEPVSFTLDTDTEATDSNDRIRYELQLNRIANSGNYEVETERLDNYSSLEDSNKSFVFEREKDLREKVHRDGGVDGKILEEVLDILRGETLIAMPGLNTNATGVLQMAEYKKYLSDWIIYHDLQTHKKAEIRQPAVTRYEKRVAHDGKNLIPVLHTLYTEDREFKGEIDAAMEAAFGDGFDGLEFPPASDQKVQLRINWKGLRYGRSMADISDGTLRFLFLVAALANPDPPSLIAIDEPEAGLHPSMMPIIAEFAVDAASRTQVILTTHSPDMLDAFHGTIPTTTIVQWEDGKTSLKVPDSDELERWLKEYTLGKLMKSGELEDME